MPCCRWIRHTMKRFEGAKLKVPWGSEIPVFHPLDRLSILDISKERHPPSHKKFEGFRRSEVSREHRIKRSFGRSVIFPHLGWCRECQRLQLLSRCGVRMRFQKFMGTNHADGKPHVVFILVSTQIAFQFNCITEMATWETTFAIVCEMGWVGMRCHGKQS